MSRSASDRYIKYHKSDLPVARHRASNTPTHSAADDDRRDNSDYYTEDKRRESEWQPVDILLVREWLAR